MKHVVLIAGLLSLSDAACGQAFKVLTISPGINFTRLSWEYRWDSNSPVERRRSGHIPVGYNLYLGTNLFQNDGSWNVHTSLGWILKKGIRTDFTNFNVPHELYYISWINKLHGTIASGKHLRVTGQLGPRIEYLLNQHAKFLEAFDPNDDSFYYRYEKNDIKKLNIGMTGGIGFTYSTGAITLGLQGWSNFNFNPVTHAKGVRKDGLGDEGFYLKMKDRTWGINVLFIVDLLNERANQG